MPWGHSTCLPGLISLVSCPRVRTLIGKLHTPGFAKFWPNGEPRWKSVLPLFSTHPSSAPLFKQRPQKLQPCCHLSCKTCLFAPLLGSLTSSGQLRLLLLLPTLLLLSFEFEGHASDGMWCMYGRVWLKGNRAGKLSLSDYAAPALLFGLWQLLVFAQPFPAQTSLG